MQVFVKVRLPFCLYLKDGWYEIVVPELSIEQKVQVNLSKIAREKEKIDYVTFWRAELTGRGELWQDRRGIFRRTEALLILPASIIELNNENSYSDQYETLIDAVVKTLNRLIEIYRFVTGDTYIPVVEPDDINNLFEVGNCSINDDGSIRALGRQVGFDNRLTNTIPDYSDSIHLELKRWFGKSEMLPLYEHFMTSARFLLGERNWRASVIEVQTAFEVYISGVVRIYYINLGRSSTEVKNILKCGFINLATVHLSQAIGKPFSSSEINYDRWYSATYLLRNRIVHNGYSPSAREAIEAVLGVEYAIEYLNGRAKEKFWPKSRPITVVNEFLEVTSGVTIEEQ